MFLLFPRTGEGSLPARKGVGTAPGSLMAPGILLLGRAGGGDSLEGLTLSTWPLRVGV